MLCNIFVLISRQIFMCVIHVSMGYSEVNICTCFDTSKLIAKYDF